MYWRLEYLGERLNEFSSIDENYFTALRSQAFEKIKEHWQERMLDFQKYKEKYYEIHNEKDPMRWGINRESILESCIFYFDLYKIYEFNSCTKFPFSEEDVENSFDDIYSQLDPEEISHPPEPIMNMDLHIYKEPITSEIAKIEAEINQIKTEQSLLDQYMDEIRHLSLREPVYCQTPEGNYWVYQNDFFQITGNYTEEEFKLLVLEFVDKERQKFERLKNKFAGTKPDEVKHERTRIPESVRIAVWRRDQGKCARCGSRENLEYDHIVPVCKGGGNTERNVELLCQNCNRSKGNRIE